MASAQRQAEFNGNGPSHRSCNLTENVHPYQGLRIDVHSSHSLGGYGTGKYHKYNRPSVIYFNGSLTTKAGATENKVDSSKLLIKKAYSTGTADKRRVDADAEDEKQQLLSQGSPESQDEEEQCRCRKRHRTSFSSSQLKRLEEEFDGDNYIIGMKRWRLSEELNIPEKQIKIWFQNRRTKSKKDYSKDFCNPLKP